MNAAFLLVTTAWIAGADTAPANPPPARVVPAPVYSVGTPGTAGCCGGASTGCGGCDSCGCEKEGFFSRLKGRFHRHNDCDCGCTSSSSSCGSCGSCGCESGGFFSHLKGHTHHNECGCDSGCGGCGSSCDSCGGHGGGLGGRLRGLFHRHGDECGCGDCGGCGGVITTVPGGPMKPEPIGQPKKDDGLKKLPSDDKKNPEKKPGSVQLIPQPVTAPNLNLAPTVSKSPF